MIYLTAEKLNKTYVERPVLQDVSLTVSEGDRIGVIGVNGTGKSTFLKIVAGLETPDSGEVKKSGGVRIGYLPQNPEFEAHYTVLQQVMKDASAQNDSKEFECKNILTRLGITDFDQDIMQLSGGQRKRVAMAAALASKVELLILDEPTNHIDNNMVSWLEEYLGRWKGALLMVTHDRYFLERVCNKIVELDRGRLTVYPANYSQYLELKAQRKEMLAATERKQETLYRKELEWIRRGARARTTKQKFRVERFAELESRECPVQESKLELHSVNSRLGKKIMEIDGISKQYGGDPLFREFSYHLLRDDRLGIIGPNGCGKSTLLKVLLGQVAPDSGSVSIGDTVRVGYFSQESEELNPDKRVIDYITDIAEQIATPDGFLTPSQILEKFLFPPDLQYTVIGRLSGGERRRLYLLSILVQAPNVLFLDEPTNDLDIQTLTILEDYLENFAGAVITVSHDRYFLDKVVDHLFSFQPDGTLRQTLGGYTDYAALCKEEARENPSVSKNTSKSEKASRPRTEKLKFSFKEQREYDEIDEVISSLEQQLADLQQEIEVQSSNFSVLPGLLERKEILERQLDEKTERWVYLNELAEKIAAQK